jgi:hypothetical protein
MDRDDPEQAADRHARAAVMAIFAVILAVAIMAAFVTTLEGIDTRYAGNVTQPGTIGLAKPHPRSIERQERLCEISSPPPL